MVSIQATHHFQLWQNEPFASSSLNSVQAEIGKSRLSFWDQLNAAAKLLSVEPLMAP